MNAPRSLKNYPLSIADPTKRFLLSELLPYHPLEKTGTRLLAGLNEYDFLLAAAEIAIKLASQQSISNFDPLVGENACQIRALKNCLIFSKYPINCDNLLKAIILSKKKIGLLILEAANSTASSFSLD
jgi:hypothetical protein